MRSVCAFGVHFCVVQLALHVAVQLFLAPFPVNERDAFLRPEGHGFGQAAVLWAEEAVQQPPRPAWGADCGCGHATACAVGSAGLGQVPVSQLDFWACWRREGSTAPPHRRGAGAGRLFLGLQSEGGALWPLLARRDQEPFQHRS